MNQSARSVGGMAGEKLVELLLQFAGGGDDVVSDPFEGCADRAFGEIGGEFGGGGIDAAVGEFAGDQCGVEGVEADELSAASDGLKERFGLIAKEDDEGSAKGFFERFEQAVLGGGVHQLGFFDDENFAVAEGGLEIGGGDEVLADDVHGKVFGDGVFLFDAAELAVDRRKIRMIPSGEQTAGIAFSTGRSGFDVGLMAESAARAAAVVPLPMPFGPAKIRPCGRRSD